MWWTSFFRGFKKIVFPGKIITEKLIPLGVIHLDKHMKAK